MKLTWQSLSNLGLLSALLIVALAGGCSSNNWGVFDGTRDIVGSGIIVTENRPVSGFNAVTFASEGSLDIVMGSTEALSIRTDDNLLPHLFTTVQGGRLSIYTESGVDVIPSGTIDFDLTAVSLGDVLHTGVGTVEIFDLTQPALTLTLTGVGSLNAFDLDTDDVDVNLAGVGGITLSGTTRRLDLSATGVGSYNGRDLQSADATVLCTGAGSVIVRASDTLHVTIVGSGVVQYIGDPTLTVDITGTGRVEQISG